MISNFNPFFDYIHGFILLFISITIGQYNSYVGATTTTILLIYAGARLYNEIKNKKNNREDTSTNIDRD